MGGFIIYMIEVAVIMSVLYLGYKWMLASATFHAFNRVVLICIYAVSLLLSAAVPMLSVTTQNAALEIGMPVAIAMMTPVDATSGDISIPWEEIISSIYFTGFAFCAALLLAAILKVSRIYHAGTPLEGYDGVRVSEGRHSPFSIAGIIMVTTSDLDEDLPAVIAHENTHRRKAHWIDLAMAQIVVLFQWFSPASWLMMRELKAVHEYEVDEEMASGNPYTYQMMLIKKAAGSSFPTFADSLNSQLKLRITMMLSKKSCKSRRFAAAALLPMAALSAFALSQPAVASVFSVIDPSLYGSEISDFQANFQIPGNETDNKTNVSLPVNADNAVSTKDDDKVYIATDKLAEFPGGIKAMMEFLTTNVKYPEGPKENTRVIVKFTVKKDGTIADAKILKSGGERFDKEALRVIKMMPKWIPGEVDNKPVDSEFTIPVQFSSYSPDSKE